MLLGGDLWAAPAEGRCLGKSQVQRPAKELGAHAEGVLVTASRGSWLLRVGQGRVPSLVSLCFKDILCMIPVLLNFEMQFMSKHAGYLDKSSKQAGKDCFPGLGVQSGGNNICLYCLWGFFFVCFVYLDDEQKKLKCTPV